MKKSFHTKVSLIGQHSSIASQSLRLKGNAKKGLAADVREFQAKKDLA
jgi:hypothetical protein